MTEQATPHEHVYRCQDCGEIGRAPLRHKAGFVNDDDGFAVAICSCGWKSNACSDGDVAFSVWTDHMSQADVQGTVTE